MDEAKLINECIKGNPKAQKQLYETFSGKMMGVCLRYSNSLEEAEDALQDGFIKVFQNLQNFQQTGSFEGWIRRIIVNCCLDIIRKNKKSKDDVALDKVDFMLSNESTAVGKLSEEQLIKLIQSMPYGYKIVFNMYAIEGYSHKEIAEHLEITESTSKSQFLRARKHLQNLLDKLETSIERD